MKDISFREFRQRVAVYLDLAATNGKPLRMRWKPRRFVILSEAAYDGIVETLHLFRNPANAKHLLRSIESADRGKLEEHALLEKPGAG